MPTKAVKRKSDAAGDETENAKKIKREERMAQFLEKMEREAEANKKAAAEKKRQSTTSSTRRQTISAGSSLPQKVEERPSRQSTAHVGERTAPTAAPSRRSRGTPQRTAPAPESSSEEEEEDDFDRLVQQKVRSWRSSGRVKGARADRNANLTSRSHSEPKSEFLKCQEELLANEENGDHSSPDSSVEEREEEEAVVVAASAPVAAIGGRGPLSGKDEGMLQIDAILFSIASFFLGVLLVVGVYFVLTSLDLSVTVPALFGANSLNVSAHVLDMAKRVVLLAIVLAITFCGIEIFLWFNSRANRKV